VVSQGGGGAGEGLQRLRWGSRAAALRRASLLLCCRLRGVRRARRAELQRRTSLAGRAGQ
jgi:hypothetical protein